MATKISTIEQFLEEVGEADVLPLAAPGNLEFSNKMLAKLVALGKARMVIDGTAQEWDSRQVFVATGTEPTKLVSVFGGDIVIARITNWDRDDGKPLFYAQERSVKPPYATAPVGTGEIRVGHLLNAGQTRSLILRRDLYAILESTATLDVPVLVEFTKLLGVDRQAGSAWR